MANIFGNTVGGQVRRRVLGGPSTARQNSVFLYSANALPSSLSKGDYDFFTVGLGGTGQGFASTYNHSFTETNLLTARRIPDQERWKITQLGFYIDGQASLTDQQKILSAGHIWLEKPDFKFVYGPPVFWPAGAGIAGMTTANAQQNWGNGWPTPTARLRLKTPVYLDPGEVFAFHYTVTSKITITLTGFTTNDNTASQVAVYILLFGETVKEIVQ